ncbi:hypothetical protein KY289_013377 [Solanum tuberosum]|nr:hypothetical protein KY289_013377 [Solanum tuberosum]
MGTIESGLLKARYGTKSCRAGRLSYRAIEAARRAIIGHFHRAMSGQLRRNGKIWVRVLADISSQARSARLYKALSKAGRLFLKCGANGALYFYF